MIKIRETQINRTENYTLGGHETYETFTDIDLPPEVVGDGAPPVAIGWIFEKTARYEDTGEPFTLETWVEIVH
jgi:hypothetical protein